MGSLPQLSIVKGQQQDFISHSLHRIFEENLLHYPTKTALIYNDNEHDKCLHLNYDQMNRKANQYARYFASETKRKCLQPNQDGDYIIVVCMHPSAELIITLMAIWKAGAAYLPIDPSFPNNRIQHILKESRPILVIHDDEIDDSKFGWVDSLSVSEINRRTSGENSSNLSEENALHDGNKEVASILYTSGSTGVPKGVRLSHEVILNRLQWQWRTFPYGANETVGVFKTALTFVDSISELWGPLMCGLAVLILPKVITKDPERLVEILEQYKIRRLVLVPTLLRSMLLYLGLANRNSLKNTPKRKLLYNLHIWVCSGEPLPMDLANNFFDYFDEGIHKLHNFYGSTEVMGDVTYFTCESKKQLSCFDHVPIGIPVSNTVIYLLDSDYRPIKNGEIGEIFVSGSNLAMGYVNGRDPGRFFENPLAIEFKYSRLYRTGDYGSIRNGNVMYQGRTDSQIKVRGHRVDLSEVEKTVSALPMIEKAVVLCYNIGKVNQAILAFVKLHDDSPLISEIQLESKLQDKLADYMRPQIVIIENVPFLVNGKVDRKALLKSYETANNNEGDSSIVLDFDYMSVPENLKDSAKVLFETVGSVIGRSTRGTTIALHNNFYELGGNSLNSIFTVTLLREKGFNIGISDFIAAKNLGEILEKMTTDGNVRSELSIQNDWSHACPHLNMESIPLQMSDKDIVTQIIVDSFYGKAELEHLLKPNISITDFIDFINDIWSDLVEKDLSFVVRDRNTNTIIGTALNFDVYDEPEVEIKSNLVIIFEFLEFLEGPLRDAYLPKGKNKVVHSFMMGTAKVLDARENIACIHFMEHEVVCLAKRKSFVGILTTNTSPLTQQLGSDIFNYKTLLDYQVNEYVCRDGSYPFGEAPDSQRVIVHYKEVTY